MFDTILVPLDGSLISECVVSHVIAFAQAFNAKVTLLRVLDKHQPGEFSEQMFDLLNWQIAKADAKIYLEKIASRLSEAGVQTVEVVIEGLAAETISEFAHTQHIKLIVLSSHGHAGLSQWGISSVTQKVIYTATSSVLIIRARQPVTGELTLRQRPYRQIMTPLDGSLRAENVLPVITLFSRFHQSTIHLSHVVKKPEMARHVPLTPDDLELSRRIVDRNREEAIRYLNQMYSYSLMVDVDLKTHLITSDNAAAALHELAEHEHIDLVVLNAHGYSGNMQWPYGSMVNNFILYGRMPLLIVQDLSLASDLPVAAQAVMAGR